MMLLFFKIYVIYDIIKYINNNYGDVDIWQYMYLKLTLSNYFFQNV